MKESREKSGGEDGGAWTLCGVEKRVHIGGLGSRMQVKGYEGEWEG